MPKIDPAAIKRLPKWIGVTAALAYFLFHPQLNWPGVICAAGVGVGTWLATGASIGIGQGFGFLIGGAAGGIARIFKKTKGLAMRMAEKGAVIGAVVGILPGAISGYKASEGAITWVEAEIRSAFNPSAAAGLQTPYDTVRQNNYVVDPACLEKPKPEPAYKNEKQHVR